MRIKFITNLCLLISLTTVLNLFCSEVNFDCIDRIKNNYDFVLFTIKTDQKNPMLAKVECNGKTVFHPFYPGVLTNTDGVIKGLVWFSLRGEEDLTYLLDGKINKFKFTILYDVDEETMKYLKHNDHPERVTTIINELCESRDVKFEVIEKDLTLPKIMLNDKKLDKKEKLLLYVYEMIMGMQEGAVSFFPVSEDFIQTLKDGSIGDSAYSDIFKLILLQSDMALLHEKAVEKSFELLPQDNRTFEEVQKLYQKHLPDTTVQKNEILNCLKKYKDSYLYHLFYPVIYIGSFIAENKLKEASKLLEQYMKEYPAYHDIPIKLKKTININNKDEEIKRYKGYKGLSLDEIIESNKLNIEDKRHAFEYILSEMAKSNKFSPEMVANIIEKIMTLGVKHGYRPAFVLFINLLPEDDNNTECALNYEKGIIIYYKNEEKISTLLKKLYPTKYSSYYIANRSAPISYYEQTLELNPNTGKHIYEYFKEVKGIRDNIFENFKWEYPESYKTVVETLEKRFSSEEK